MTHQPATTPAAEALAAWAGSAVIAGGNGVERACQRRWSVRDVWVWLAVRAGPTRWSQLRPGGVVTCRPDWAGSATPPADAAGPAITPCIGPPLRPLAVGYPRLQPSEVSSRERAAFRALVEALRRAHIHAVAIPSSGHFSRFDGIYQAMRILIETETGTRVLAVSDRLGSAR